MVLELIALDMKFSGIVICPGSLVSRAAIISTTTLWLTTTEVWRLTVLEDGSLKSSNQQGWFFLRALMETLFPDFFLASGNGSPCHSLVHRCITPISALICLSAFLLWGYWSWLKVLHTPVWLYLNFHLNWIHKDSVSKQSTFTGTRD